MRLTDNFYLDEFLKSQTAARTGIDMTPSDEVVANLTKLARTVLQPLREVIGPIIITSGYRPMTLNTLIGGSKTSQHMTGQAADLYSNRHNPLFVCQQIVLMELPYDQVIHEFGEWVHVSWSDDPRFEQLTAYRDKGKTKYKHGLWSMEDC